MTDAAPTPPPRKRRVRVRTWLLGLLLAVLVLIVGVRWWAGSDGSLPRALQFAQRFLPDDQQLAISDAVGSISGGGHIARLQWSMPGISVTIDDLQLEWSLRLLFGRALDVRTLSARNLNIRLTPQPDEPDEPFTMPEDVSLPIKVTLPLTIARTQIETVDADGIVSTQEFDDLAARYQFDGKLHALQLSSFRYGQSQARGDLQLHAQTLALSAQIDATLRDLAPDTPFAMLAHLQANGSLADGEKATLDVRLNAEQQANGVPMEDGAQIHAQTTLHPWRKQPAQQVEVQLSHLNAHAFSVQAPVTALHGQASLEPASDAASLWNAVVDFTNDQPGAWDRQQLPLRTLSARATLSLEQLDIEMARADLGGRSSAGTITVTGQIPLQQLTQSTLQLDLQKVDLRPLLTTLPNTAFIGSLTIKPWQQDSWQAQADIRNALAGPLDRDRAPLDRLLADLRVGPLQWRAENLELQIGAGRARIQGEFAPQTQIMDVHGDITNLPLRQIHRKMAADLASQLSGKLAVTGSLQQGLDFKADVTSDAADTGASTPDGQWEIRAIQTRGSWSPARLSIEQLHLDALQATVDGNNIEVSLPGLDSIKASLSAAAPGMKLEVDTSMRQQSGEGKLSVDLDSAEKVVAWLQGLPFIGKQMPDLHARGAASVQADWAGGWRQWVAGFRKPASQPQLRVSAIARTSGLRIDVPAVADQPPTLIDVQKLDLDLQGNLAAATLAINGDARANDVHAVVDIGLQATQENASAGAPRWHIAVEKFMASATLPKQEQPWQLQLSDNLQITAQTGADIELQATAGTATILAPTGTDTASEPMKLAWQPVLWRRTSTGATTLQSAGTVTGIQPAWADVLLARNGEGPLAGAGMRSDLSLSGEWDVQMTDSVNIRAHLTREHGDLWLLEPSTAAGIRDFDVTMQSSDEKVNLSLNWDTERAGVITAKVGTQLAQQAGGWSLPDDAPLSGTIEAHVKDLNTWAFLAPPGWRISGAMDANLRLAGTVHTPQLNGDLTATGLNFRSILDGVDLHDGTLHATLKGSRMEIADLTFQGGTGSRAYVRGFSGNRTQPSSNRGSMTASGSIDWSGVANASAAESGIVMDVNAELTRMQVLVRNDRQMTLSGKLSAGLDQGSLRVSGDIHVDRASIVLPEASAPTLGSDVEVVRNTDLKNPGAVESRQARGELETRKPMDMEITLDLGSDLALEGQGITTRLEGELTVRSSTIGSDPFSVFGEVRTVEGRYRAWGQALNVETGVVRFNGPSMNPSLNLLAIRPEIDVRAGVRVTGTLNAPRVQLYSDPDLPEGEKLSWVVLGRATVVAGAEGTSMQQAAMSLAAGQLSGKLASGLGLDELGLGDTGVTIGKRLSNELYLTYEAGLSGAASTLFIFYDITRRLTLRAQASEASAVDMIYTIKFD